MHSAAPSPLFRVSQSGNNLSIRLLHSASSFYHVLFETFSREAYATD